MFCHTNRPLSFNTSMIGKMVELVIILVFLSQTNANIDETVANNSITSSFDDLQKSCFDVIQGDEK